MITNNRKRRINTNQNYSELSEDAQINSNLTRERCNTNNKRFREIIFNMSEFEKDTSTESGKESRNKKLSYREYWCNRTVEEQHFWRTYK